jgi:hypothetical protein
MVSLEDAATTTRRWDRWKPYAVIGAGVIVAAIGIPLQLKARSDFDAYDAGVAQECGDLGCAPGELSESTRNLESQAKLENRIAVTSFAIGGAVAATGVVLLILNRPRTVLPENLDLAPESPTVTVVPVLSPDTAGVSVGVRF